MFCPNCGKDCMEAKFCPECGQDLRKTSVGQSFAEKRKALQASGQVYCPRCLATSVSISNYYGRYRSYTPVRSLGALIVEILGRLFLIGHHKEYGDKCVCLNCGNEWFSKRVALQERHREHIARLFGEYSGMNYPGIGGTYLDMDSERIMISLSGKNGCIIPYDELAIVDHKESIWPFYGRLTILDRAHRKRPFPKTLEAAQKDRFTILYDSGYLEGYRQLAATLKVVVEENKKAGLF